MEFYIFKNIYYDVFIYDILEKSNKKQKKVKKNESNVRAKSNDIFETTIISLFCFVFWVLKKKHTPDLRRIEETPLFFWSFVFI